MKIPSNSLACQTLFLQAADEGRGPVLFGDSFERTREAVLPFVEGVPFPSLYLEFPLAGDPFLDVTVLYGEMPPGTRFRSEAAAGTEKMLDWYVRARTEKQGICCGFELDSKNHYPGSAAVHFQSYGDYEIAGQFCEALGEPEAGKLYQDLAARMPEGWPLSFFGLFRGRPGSPLRVCGYMGMEEKQHCSEDPGRLETVFREIGFSSFDDAMIRQISAALSAAPGTVDFQFDVYPDGRLGNVFAIDIAFEVTKSEELVLSFDKGSAAAAMKLLESWGAADSRWKLAAGASFTRSLPVEDENGELKPFALVLTPNWAKVRWRDGILQKSKLYCLGRAGLVSELKKNDAPRQAKDPDQKAE